LTQYRCFCKNLLLTLLFLITTLTNNRNKFKSMRQFLPLLALGLWIAISMNVTAQLVPQNARLGVHVSPTISWYKAKSDSINGTGIRLTSGIGFMYDRPLFNDSERWILSSGLQITHTGGKFKATNADSITTTALRIKYWEVPLTVKYKFKDKGKFSPFAQAGLIPGITFNTRYDRSTPEFASVVDAKAGSITQPFNLLYTVGGGTDYYIDEKLSAFAGFYYSQGLFNIVTDGDGKAIKNAYLMCKVGVFFNKAPQETPTETAPKDL